MYNNVSNEFKEAVKSNAVTSTARITVYNSDDTTTLITGENIKTVKITDNCYNEGVIIGTTMAKEAEIEIINNNYDLADKEFDLELGIEISTGIFEYVPYGRYIVKTYEDTKSNNTYKIIAYDYMDKLNAKFEDTNAYPITLQEFYESLATQYNVEIEAQELPNQDFNITEKPYFEGMSGRNVLSAIAQMFGSFAKFNRQNKVQMYLTNTTDEQITRSQMNSSLEVDKMYGPVNVVVLKLGQVEGENITLRDDESIALYGETTLTIEDNPFVYSQELRQLAIQGIYDRVKGFKYIPTTFNYKSPLYLDCGDTIGVQLMNSDDYVSSIVLNQYIEVPSTRKSKCENKALTNTAIKHQFTPAEVVRNKRTEIMVDKQNGTIQSLTATTEGIQDSLTNNYYTIDQSNELVQNAAQGLANTFKTTGGQNYIKDSMGILNDGSWTNIKSITDDFTRANATGLSAIILQDTTENAIKQNIQVKNGTYTISFEYYRPNVLTNDRVKINDTEYVLSEAWELTEFTQTIAITSGEVNIEFLSDTDNSCYILDLMMNNGTEKATWSQNANETITDTVKIGKGIEVDSDITNTKSRMDSDGFRIENKTTRENVLQATDKGIVTNELKSRGTSNVNGLLVIKVGNQTWLEGV